MTLGTPGKAHSALELLSMPYHPHSSYVLPHSTEGTIGRPVQFHTVRKEPLLCRCQRVAGGPWALKAVPDEGLPLGDQSRIPVDNTRAAHQYGSEGPLNLTLRAGMITSLCVANSRQVSVSDPKRQTGTRRDSS